MGKIDEFDKYTDNYSGKIDNNIINSNIYEDDWDKYLDDNKNSCNEEIEKHEVSKDDLHPKEEIKPERLNTDEVTQEDEIDEEKDSDTIDKSLQTVESLPEEYIEKVLAISSDEEKEQIKQYFKFLKEQKEREQSQQYKEQMGKMQTYFTPEVELAFAEYMLSRRMISKEQFKAYLESKGITPPNK